MPIDDIDVVDIAVVVISGVAGGVLNCLLLDGGFAKPRKRSSDDNMVIWDPGFLSKIVLGIGASILIWGLGAHELPWKKMLAMCLLSGTYGGNLIASILQRKALELASGKSQLFFEYSSRLAKMVGKEEGNE
ncbi:MAG: hypothetical protein ABSG91_12680 [Syntrophobacteraceae bacterium]|jgi:hypothetical protein